MAYSRKKKTYHRKAKNQTKLSVNRIKRALHLNPPEVKFFDYQISFTVGNSWAFKSLMAAGPSQILAVVGQTVAAANSRIGNKIFLRKITGFVEMVPAVTAANTAGFLSRCVIYHNKFAVGALPVVADVFLDPLGGAVDYKALRVMSKKNKISLLVDDIVAFVPLATNGASVSAMGPEKCHPFTIQVNKIIDYIGNATTIADIFKDDYGFGCCGNAAVNCNMFINYRLHYTDS